ncbi:MAG: osmotically inducible protein C [Pyrinomonas sp.]|uniref:OsmC family protein n=1 Tax=Pyrinomonas sp. TaxID=2080306 RepID=UPI00332625E3
MSEVIVRSLGNFQNEVIYGEGQTFIIDEPVSAGGDGAGPDPYTLILAALGGCISMTVMMYARRKNWPLESVRVRLRQRRIHAGDCAECAQSESGYIHLIERRVEFDGPLTDEQRARLREIASRCPVHRTLTSRIAIAEMQD